VGGQYKEGFLMTKSTKIWPGWPIEKSNNELVFGHDLRRKNQKKQLEKDRLRLLDWFDEKVPGVKTGVKDLIIDEQITDQIQQLIEETLNTGRNHYYLRHFIRTGLIAGKEKLNWQTAIPPAEIIWHSHKPIITPDEFHNFNLLKKINSKFIDHITPPNLNNSLQVTQFIYGRLLYSAVIFGGLTDTAALLQLPYCTKNIKRYKGFVWELWSNLVYRAKQRLLLMLPPLVCHLGISRC